MTNTNIQPNGTTSSTVDTLSAFARGLLITATCILFALVSLIALASAFGVIKLPFEMSLLADRMPVIFPLHMAASAAALLLLPVVISVRHRPNLHRKVGRLLGVFVVAGGLSALPVAIFSHSSDMARLGFAVQGVVWLGLLALGVAAIRNGNLRQHMLAMIAMTAVTTGAVWFRLTIGTAILLKLPFETSYAIAAWTSWTVPLLVVVALRTAIARSLSVRRPKGPVTGLAMVAHKADRSVPAST